jgi:hypothetical protein
LSIAKASKAKLDHYLEEEHNKRNTTILSLKQNTDAAFTELNLANEKRERLQEQKAARYIFFDSSMIQR